MLKLENIGKTYRTTEVETAAVNDVSLEIKAGEFLAIMGPSGCGKSTLLNLLGLLDSPSSGRYWFFGEEISQYSEKKLTVLRRENIGFIFQSFNLIDELTVRQNVEVSLIYRRVPAKERERRANEALERVGILHRSKHFPQQLSGGQQQRVAVARALVSNPKLILADEPTGNLDSENGEAVMNLLTDLSKAGTTVVMVTHSLEHAAYAQRTINILDGKIQSKAEVIA